MNNTIGACYSPQLKAQIEKYGIVKFTIICPEFCIAFAGNNIFLACRLFDKLSSMKQFFRKDVINEAFEIHKSADDYNDIEFIIASAEDGITILDCIKDGAVCEDVDSAWLGSYQAFSSFQKIRIKSNAGVKDATDLSFKQVVEGCVDESVGGFPICVQYYADCNSFRYAETYCYISNKKQIVQSGEPVFFYTSAHDGGMSYRVMPYGLDNVILNIDQIKPSILYSRGHRYDNPTDTNRQLFGLMLPMEIVETGEDQWKCFR